MFSARPTQRILRTESEKRGEDGGPVDREIRESITGKYWLKRGEVEGPGGGRIEAARARFAATFRARSTSYRRRRIRMWRQVRAFCQQRRGGYWDPTSVRECVTGLLLGGWEREKRPKAGQDISSIVECVRDAIENLEEGIRYYPPCNRMRQIVSGGIEAYVEFIQGHSERPEMPFEVVQTTLAKTGVVEGETESEVNTVKDRLRASYTYCTRGSTLTGSGRWGNLRSVDGTPMAVALDSERPMKWWAKRVKLVGKKRVSGRVEMWPVSENMALKVKQE